MCAIAESLYLSEVADELSSYTRIYTRIYIRIYIVYINGVVIN